MVHQISPSQINLFNAEPSAWAWRYLLGNKTFKGNHATVRGNSVGEAVEQALIGQYSLAWAVDRAVMLFHELLAKEGLEAACAVEHGIPEYTGQLMTLLQGKPVLNRQATMDWQVNDYVLIRGYGDLVMMDGLIIDLKTTDRIMSKLPWHHVIQQAVYSASRDHAPAALAYASRRRAVLMHITDDEMRQAKYAIKSIVQAMLPYLRAKDEELEIKHLIRRSPPRDQSSWIWEAGELAAIDKICQEK